VDEFIRVLGEYGITATPRTRRGSVFIKFISCLQYFVLWEVFLLLEQRKVAFFILTILILFFIFDYFNGNLIVAVDE
jgi:hypothetical protein